MFVVYVLSEKDDFAKKANKMPGNLFFKTIDSLSRLPKNERGVVLAYNTGETEGEKVPSGYVGIAMEGDSSALTIFRDSEVPVVTCGFSPTSTVTVSGITLNGAAVSIQRNMPSLKGRPIEEGEISFKINEGIDNFVLMAWAAAGLLMFGEEEFLSFV